MPKVSPRTTSSSSSSSHKSHQVKKRTRTIERLEAISTILEYLEKIADQTPVPGFGLAVTSVKLIVDAVKKAKSNVEDALGLAERICKLLEAISKRSEFIPDQMKANIEKFHATLEDIRESIAQITCRERSIIVFLNFLGDAQIVKESNKKVDAAIELFKLQGDIALHNEAAKLRSTTTSILQELKTLKSNQSPTTSTASTAHSSPLPSPKTLAPTPEPTLAKHRSPQSSSSSRKATKQRPRSQASPSSVGSGPRNDDSPPRSSRVTSTEIITKTTTHREIETNTKTTKETRGFGTSSRPSSYGAPLVQKR